MIALFDENLEALGVMSRNTGLSASEGQKTGRAHTSSSYNGRCGTGGPQFLWGSMFWVEQLHDKNFAPS
jgi:hypothetical protein